MPRKLELVPHLSEAELKIDTEKLKIGSKLDVGICCGKWL
jgi:hypothetical protein